MAEITDEMAERALAVIMTPPGLQYFDDLVSMTYNREVVRCAIAAALGEYSIKVVPDPFRMPMVEDRIRDAMAGAQDHPGRAITR